MALKERETKNVFKLKLIDLSEILSWGRRRGNVPERHRAPLNCGEVRLVTHAFSRAATPVMNRCMFIQICRANSNLFDILGETFAQHAEVPTQFTDTSSRAHCRHLEWEKMPLQQGIVGYVNKPTARLEASH